MLASEAEIPSAAPQQWPAPPPPQITPDPLGRDTPLGTVFGFIKAAQEENYQLALRYFQATSRRKPRQEDEKLVHQLNIDRKSTRLNSSHGYISYAVFCLKKKKKKKK